MTQAYLNQFASENGFVAVTRVSAKTGENVNITFANLVREILLREFNVDSDQPDEDDRILRESIA